MKIKTHHSILLALAVLLVNACTQKVALVSTQNQQYRIDSNLQAKPEIDSYLSPFRDSLEKMVDRVIASSEVELTIGRSGKELVPSQVALGNFMSDAILKIATEKASALNKPKPDLSLFTWGSFRKSLPKGNITLRNIFELMPFENEMVVLTLSGTQLKALLEQISKGYNPVAGVTMKVGDLNSIRINGEPIQETGSYQVVVSDYHSFGGDNLFVLTQANDSYLSGIKIRDAIVLYLQQLTEVHQTLKPDYEARIAN